jgi:hypothetical protein
MHASSALKLPKTPTRLPEDPELKDYIGQLRRELPYVPPVSTRDLKRLHRRRDYEGMVRLIRRGMNLDVRLTIGWVNSGGPKGFEKAPAWVERPANMPRYGTPAFKDTTVTIFIRKGFLESSTYAQTAIAIAHELSHVVLDSIQHPLRKNEKAVDLTAMLLGFSRLYYSASYTLQSVDFLNNPTWRQLGYLTPFELRTASRILVPRHMRVLQNIRWTVRSYKRILIFWAVLLGLVGSGTIQKKWQLQSTVWSEKARLEAKLPFRVNNYLTLIDVRVGLLSLTRTYRLPMMPRDMASFERSVRRDICATEAPHVKDGISYTSEYQGPSGDPIARIEVDSCP